jgi:hypothetical protein
MNMYYGNAKDRRSGAYIGVSLITILFCLVLRLHAILSFIIARGLGAYNHLVRSIVLGLTRLMQSPSSAASPQLTLVRSTGLARHHYDTREERNHLWRIVFDLQNSVSGKYLY